jgi:ribosomal protein L37E
MSKWRWPTWAMIGSTAALVLAIIVLTMAQDESLARNDSYTAGRNVGRAISPFLWGWVLGMIVLGVVWRRTRVRAVCPRCGEMAKAKWPTCPRCGLPFAQTGVNASGYQIQPGGPTAMCPRCGQQVDPRAQFCPRCGYAPGQPPA